MIPVAGFVRGVALRMLRSVSPPPQRNEVIVLGFHSISSRSHFADQMHAIADSGYEVLALPSFKRWLSGDIVLDRPGVLLTFDDAYRNQLINAVPVLERARWAGVFFVATAYLGGQAGWREEFGSRRVLPLPLMGAGDLRELSAAGHAIGCHSSSHTKLTNLAVAEIERDVTEGRRALVDLLCAEVPAFCYPYGAYNPRVAEAVRNAGFELAFTVDRGFARAGDDPLTLRRICVLDEPRRLEFEGYLSGAVLRYWQLRARTQ